MQLQEKVISGLASLTGRRRMSGNGWMELYLCSSEPNWFLQQICNHLNVTNEHMFLERWCIFHAAALRKWKPGQPDNWTHGHEQGEDCAGLIHNANWNDFYCTDRIGFICERASDRQYSLYFRLFPLEWCVHLAIFCYTNNVFALLWIISDCYSVHFQSIQSYQRYTSLKTNHS